MIMKDGSIRSLQEHMIELRNVYSTRDAGETQVLLDVAKDRAMTKVYAKRLDQIHHIVHKQCWQATTMWYNLVYKHWTFQELL